MVKTTTVLIQAEFRNLKKSNKSKVDGKSQLLWAVFNKQNKVGIQIVFFGD